MPDRNEATQKSMAEREREGEIKNVMAVFENTEKDET